MLGLQQLTSRLPAFFQRRRDKEELLAIQRSFQEAEDELEKFKASESSSRKCILYETT